MAEPSSAGKSLSVLGGFLSGISAFGESRKEAEALGLSAEEELRLGKVRRRQFKLASSRTLGEARALRGGSGIAFTGSPLLVDEATVRQIAKGEREIVRQAAGRAKALKKQAKKEKKGGLFEAGLSILGGFL